MSNFFSKNKKERDEEKMFEIAEQMLVQEIDLIPYILILSIIFDFLGSFFFGKK